MLLSNTTNCVVLSASAINCVVFWVIMTSSTIRVEQLKKLLKLFYLALRNISSKWTVLIREWKAALTRFTIQFKDRMNNIQPKPRLHKIPDTLEGH